MYTFLISPNFFAQLLQRSLLILLTLSTTQPRSRLCETRNQRNFVNSLSFMASFNLAYPSVFFKSQSFQTTPLAALSGISIIVAAYFCKFSFVDFGAGREVR